MLLSYLCTVEHHTLYGLYKSFLLFIYNSSCHTSSTCCTLIWHSPESDIWL